MELVLDLTDQETQRLIALARTRGRGVVQVAHDLLSADLVLDNPPIEDHTLALLSQWADEDATDDIMELERRDSETAELMANVNAERFTFPLRIK